MGRIAYEIILKSHSSAVIRDYVVIEERLKNLQNGTDRRVRRL